MLIRVIGPEFSATSMAVAEMPGIKSTRTHRNRFLAHVLDPHASIMPNQRRSCGTPMIE
jgi:hypothetical protein